MAAAIAGGALLLLSEFLPLLHTHLDSSSAAVASTTVGSAHGYAGVPIAVLACVFGIAVGRLGSRPALLGLGLLGVLALVIALTHDLPAAGQQGMRLVHGHVAAVADTVAFGFYVETFAALLLLLTCACGFVLIGAPVATRGARGSKPPVRANR
jgi:hypothetical protein